MTAALTSVGVQYGSVTIANGSTSGTANITATGAGAVLLYLGQTTTLASANPARGLARITLTNSTTITATRNTADTATITVYFAVLDGDTTNLIKSVQYGSINFGAGTTGTATINAVTTANTAVHCLGYTTTATTTTPITLWTTVELTNTTTVTATLGTSPGANTATVNFVVIEFQSTALTSLQFVSDSASPTGTTRTHAITAVTLANTLTIWAGQRTSGGANYSGGDQYGQLTANNTLTIGTNGAANVSITYNCFVVELVSGLVETGAQRGNISIAAGTSGTAALSPSVTVADAVMNFCGNQTNGTTFDTRNSALSALITNQVTASTNTSATTKTGWEVLALNPAAGGGGGASRRPDFMSFF